MKQYTNQTLIQLLWWIFFYGNIFLNPAYSMQMKATRPIRHYPVIPSNTSMTIQAHREHGVCLIIYRESVHTQVVDPYFKSITLTLCLRTMN